MRTDDALRWERLQVTRGPMTKVGTRLFLSKNTQVTWRLGRQRSENLERFRGVGDSRSGWGSTGVRHVDKFICDRSNS